MDWPLVVSAFTLGAFAFFSPCGFPMLPAYVAYYLPRDAGAEGGLARNLARGLGGGALASLGAFAVIALVGALALAIGAPLKERVVHLELVGGLLVIGLGLLTLAGRGPSVRFALRPSQRRGALGLLSFGALYATAGASCVAPLFIAVLVTAGTGPEGALVIGTYALAFSLLLLALTALVATTQGALVRRLRSVLPHVERASGVVLLLVGLWLITYWASVVLGG